jgi:hypothetical protein
MLVPGVAGSFVSCLAATRFALRARFRFVVRVVAGFGAVCSKTRRANSSPMNSASRAAFDKTDASLVELLPVASDD